MNSEDKNKDRKEVEKHLTTTAKQSSIIFIGRFTGFFLGFLVNFILARLFGAKVVGQYSLVKTIVNVLVIFSVFGLNNGLVKYASRYISAKEENKLIEVVKVSFIYAGFFSIIGSISIFLFSRIIANKIFNDSELVTVLNYGAWLVIPLTLRRIFNGLYRSFKQMKDYIIIVQVFRRIAFIIVLIILVKLDFKYTSYVVSVFLVIEIVNLIHLLKRTDKLGIDLKFCFLSKSHNKGEDIKKELLSYSSTVIFIHFMHLILNKIDRIMLGVYRTSEMVGVYNTAASVTVLLTFFLTSSNMIFSPIISELYSNNKMKVIEDLYSTITKWLIILTLPIMINIFFFSDTIMNFFGEEYLIGASSLIILAVGQLINTCVGATGYILNMCGYEKVLLINNVLMAVINFFLNLILIPKLGIIGAAIATGLAIASINLINVFQIKYYLNVIPYSKKYLHIIINLVVIIIFSLLIKIISESIIAVVLCTAISMLISFAISYIFRDELDQFVFDKFKIKLEQYLM